MLMLSIPRPHVPPESYYTDDDHAVMRFRMKHHFAEDVEMFSMYVGEGAASDDSDAHIMFAMAKCCDTLREFGRMRTDYLIEECLARLR